MKVFIKIIILIVVFNSATAQVTQEWVSRYNGTGNSADEASSLAVDGSGNVYVTGYSLGSGTDRDYATIKYNSSGDQQWVARNNGPGNLNDYANSIAVDGSGNVYVSGYSYDNGTELDYATIKYNSSGAQQWVARYNGPGEDRAYSIAVDGSGNVYVTGYSSGSGTEHDYATIKYNSSGVQQWVARYNGPGNDNDEANSVAVDGSGNVYVTGFSSGLGIGVYATIKYNSSGVQQWVSTYNGWATSLAVDGSGNVYVTGFSAGDYATIKYNSSGVQQWAVRYNGPGNDLDYSRSLAVDGSGNVYVAGTSLGGSTFGAYATVKYNSSGVQQWASIYSGPGNSNNDAESLALDGSGNVYVTGSSSAGSGTFYDYATIKYNSSGVQQWVTRYNGLGEDEASSLALDSSGNVYVTGHSSGSGTDADYATIKYSQSVGIKQLSSILPDRFSISQNYPNPFNPSTKIKFDIIKSGLVKLKIFDISGKEVALLVEENLSPGSYETEFVGSNFTSGVYFYKIETGSFVETKKMLMIK